MAFADLVLGIDRAALLHLGGVAVIYQPASGPAVTVEGMFDDHYYLTDDGQAAVFLLLADLPVHPDDDDPVLTIEGKDWHVRLRQPDGLGGIRLVLVEAGF